MTYYFDNNEFYWHVFVVREDDILKLFQDSSGFSLFVNTRGIGEYDLSDSIKMPKDDNNRFKEWLFDSIFDESIGIYFGEEL